MRRALCFLMTALAAAAQPSATEGHIEKLSAGHEFVSALAWSREGFLAIADGPAGKILRMDAKGKSVFHDGIAAVGLEFDEEGRLYVCEGRSRNVVRVDRRNRTEVVASQWEGKRLNGPSDIAVLKKDHIYFTDPAFASADEAKELPHYGIYHTNPKGEMAAVAILPSRPNGIALAHDGRTLYASIADTRSILAWSVDRNGVASNQRVFVSGIDGIPDGLDIAPDGRVFVAARELLIYSPDGKLLRTQPVSGKPVDVVLGESDFNTAFIAAGDTVFRFRLPPELQSKTGAHH